MRTLQQPFYLHKFRGILKLSEVLCLLRQIFPLKERVALIGNNVRRNLVQAGHQVTQANLCEQEVSVFKDNVCGMPSKERLANFSMLLSPSGTGSPQHGRNQAHLRSLLLAEHLRGSNYPMSPVVFPAASP
jgi:hypothetical protein